MIRRVLRFGALLLVLTPSVVSAQAEQWTSTVRNELERYGSALRQDRFVMQGEPFTGSLAVTKSEDHSFSVQAGVDYAVLGVCDQDCSDIDLRIEDESGTVLAQDYENDDHPTVRFTPRGSRVNIHVYMASCSREPCFWGVGVYSRGGGANAANAGPNSAAAAGTGGSAERWLSTVRNELDRYGNQLLAGYGLVGTPTTGSISSTSSDDVWVTLNPNVEYAILGVCDQDCSDIDLKLTDDGDHDIASDYEKDDHPIVRVTPIRPGRFKVHIYMATCSQDPCFYGIGVYARGAAGANSAAATVGSGTATGSGAARWLATVRSELEKYGPQLVQEGYTLLGDSYTGSLRKERSEDVNVPLEAGFDYAFLGVCDSDCGDIDLSLADADGHTVDTDYDKNDHPVVRVARASHGTYIVHVYMASCANEPCYYGVGVYRRTAVGGKGGEDDAPPRAADGLAHPAAGPPDRRR